MLCSVSRVQCHMASRAAVGPGAQPSHPTLQMGLSACLPASHTTAPRRRHKPRWYPSISPGGFNLTGAQITLQDNKTPNTTAGLGESRGAGVPGWGGPPRTVHLANRAESKVLPSHGASFTPGSETGREERWSTPPSSLRLIFPVQSQLIPFFL